MPYARFGAPSSQPPRLAALFVIAVQMERLALMAALAVTGNASARERMARLLLDPHARLTLPGGIIAREGPQGHRMTLLDLATLKRLSPLRPRQPAFCPNWPPAATSAP